MSLTVRPEDGETDVLGKFVEELQSGVTVSGDSISGTLHYVTDYTGFSGDPEEQSGNYLVLHCDMTEDPNDVITVELLHGTLGRPVTLDEDHNIVLKIGDTTQQQVRVVGVHEGESIVKTYSLSNLTLESEASDDT